MSYISDARKNILHQHYANMTAIGKIKRLIDAVEPDNPVDEKTVREWGRSLGLVRGNYRGGRAKPLTEKYEATIWQMVKDPMHYWSWVEIAATLSAIGRERITSYAVKQWARKMGVPPRVFPGNTTRPEAVVPINTPKLAAEYTDWDVVVDWAMKNKIDARKLDKPVVLTEVNSKRQRYGLPCFAVRVPAIELRLVK